MPDELDPFMFSISARRSRDPASQPPPAQPAHAHQSARAHSSNFQALDMEAAGVAQPPPAGTGTIAASGGSKRGGKSHHKLVTAVVLVLVGVVLLEHKALLGLLHFGSPGSGSLAPQWQQQEQRGRLPRQVPSSHAGGVRQTVTLEY